VSVRAEAREQAHDNESENNAGKSEAKNLAHVVSRDASPGGKATWRGLVSMSATDP